MKWRFSQLIGLCAFVGTGLIVPDLALASDIKAYPPRKADDPAFIVIDGEVKSGDDEKFRKLAAEYSDAVVLLNSEGGMIGPAMDIGRTIKLRGYETAIYKTGSCASACALIWLAGSKRVLFEGGKLAFMRATLIPTAQNSRLVSGMRWSVIIYRNSDLAKKRSCSQPLPHRIKFSG